MKVGILISYGEALKRQTANKGRSQRRELSRLVLVAMLAISNGATVHGSRQSAGWVEEA